MKYVDMVTHPSYIEALCRVEKKHPEWFEYYARKACQEVEQSLNRMERSREMQTQ